MATPSLEYVTGWGVYIIEGPNWRGISWLGAIVYTLSVMIAVVYSVMRKDPSSGFTIGAFIVSLWIAWTTAFYYQFKEA
jgi:ascorbate-specific PTS system EIIC-type component UlaA